MHTVATVAVLVVAALHAYFAWLEMVMWTRPAGRRAFGLDADFATRTKGLAANQGLYNLFLVAGLLWGIATTLGDGSARPGGVAIETFFLACVIVAGLFGAATVSRRILLVQALPGAIALALVWLARGA